MSSAVITCDRIDLIHKSSVILRINRLFTNLIRRNTGEQSHRLERRGLAKYCGRWNCQAKPAFPAGGSCRHAFRRGTKLALSIPKRPGFAENLARQAQTNLRSGKPAKWCSADAANGTCDKAAPAAAVMLHLRSRYVSKAAILTVPVPPVSVENRSPA